MKNCPNCGNQNNDYNKICSKCGFDFDSVNYENYQMISKKSPITLLLLIIILLLVSLIGLLGYIMFSKGQGNKVNNENIYSEVKILETIPVTETSYIPETVETTAEIITTTINTSTAKITTTQNITTVITTVTEKITTIQATQPPTEENTQPVQVQEEKIPEPVQNEQQSPEQNQEQEYYEEPAPEPVQNEQPAPQPVYEEPAPQPVQEEPQQPDTEDIENAIIQALVDFQGTQRYKSDPIHNFGIFDMNHDGIPELFIRTHQGDSQRVYYYLYFDGKYQELYSDCDACRISEEYGMIWFRHWFNSVVVIIGDDGYIESERILEGQEDDEFYNYYGVASWGVPWQEGSEF